MPDLLFIPVTGLYLLVIGLLFVFGVNFFYLTYLALTRPPARPLRDLPEPLPVVTVQLPIYNELYVAERLVDAVARLDYPADRLEIQVLDDSTDETAALLSRAASRLQARGLDVRLLHRADRRGYKAGALAAGLEQARGEFLAVFDADFIPPPDFLRRALPPFADPRTAFVQARWGHLNRDYSLLTRLQSLAIDAHFIVEQAARSRGGFWFNFNGTAGVWRKAAILSAGGWKSDTLTEDLDLSYRAFLQGWEAVYLPEVEVPAELPVTFSAYRRQQHRWARGSLEVALKLFARVWRSPIPLSHKVEATLHLGGYGVHLLLFALAVLYPLVLLVSRGHPGLSGLLGAALAFNATAFAPTLFFIAAQRLLGRNWLRQVPAILFMTCLGSGMMLNTLRGALQILLGHSAAFERTPKYGITSNRQDWSSRPKYHLGFDPILLGEGLFALWNAATLVLAIRSHSWSIALYAALFCAGLLFVLGMSLVQDWTVRRQLPLAASLGAGGARHG